MTSETTDRSRYSKSKWVFALGLLIIAAVAILLRLQLLSVYRIGPDEAIHLVWLRSLAAGYQPYTQVYITYPPLYPLMLQAVWTLWPGQIAQHWLSVAFALFGALGTALLARRIGGLIAGWSAALLVLFSPYLLVYSVAILGEFHAVVWAVWAVWFACRYVDVPSTRQARVWLALSGVALAASVLTKVLLPFMPGVVAVFILVRYWSSDARSIVAEIKRLWQDSSCRNAILRDGVWLGVFMALPIAAALFRFDLASLADQVVGQRVEARAAYVAAGDFWLRRWDRILDFVRQDTVLVILAMIGLGVLFAHRHRDRIWLIVWLALGAAMLTLHDPVRHKHLVMFIPPLAILAGVGVSFMIAERRQVYRIIGVLTLASMAFIYPRQVMAPLAEWQARAGESLQPGLLAFIAQTTAPDDCLVSDEMKLVYYSNRATPPELAEVSENRLASGALTFAELIALTNRDDCQIIAPVSDIPRFTKYASDYLIWVEQNYLGKLPAEGNTTFYFAKKDTVPDPAISLEADFDGRITFHGYNLPAESVSPGEAIPLTLTWQAQTAIDTDYKIFVQLRDAAHNTLVSADHQPYLGYLPTSSWPAGAVVRYTIWLELPADLPPGEYPVYVGLYHPATGERLTIIGDTSGENAVMLGPLAVQ